MRQKALTLHHPWPTHTGTAGTATRTTMTTRTTTTVTMLLLVFLILVGIEDFLQFLIKLLATLHLLLHLGTLLFSKLRTLGALLLLCGTCLSISFLTLRTRTAHTRTTMGFMNILILFVQCENLRLLLVGQREILRHLLRHLFWSQLFRSLTLTLFFVLCHHNCHRQEGTCCRQLLRLP